MRKDGDCTLIVRHFAKIPGGSPSKEIFATCSGSPPTGGSKRMPIRRNEGFVQRRMAKISLKTNPNEIFASGKGWPESRKKASLVHRWGTERRIPPTGGSKKQQIPLDGIVPRPALRAGGQNAEAVQRQAAPKARLAQRSPCLSVLRTTRRDCPPPLRGGLGMTASASMLSMPAPRGCRSGLRQRPCHGVGF